MTDCVVLDFFAGEEIDAGDAVCVGRGGVAFRAKAEDRDHPIGVALNKAITTQLCQVVTHGLAKSCINACAGQLVFVAQGGGLTTVPPPSGNYIRMMGTQIDDDHMVVNIQDFGRKT